VLSCRQTAKNRRRARLLEAGEQKGKRLQTSKVLIDYYLMKKFGRTGSIAGQNLSGVGAALTENGRTYRRVNNRCFINTRPITKIDNILKFSTHYIHITSSTTEKPHDLCDTGPPFAPKAAMIQEQGPIITRRTLVGIAIVKCNKRKKKNPDTHNT
jgi:hypothetical protein